MMMLQFHQAKPVRQKQLKIRQISREQFGVVPDSDGGNQAVGSRTAPTPGLIEKIGGDFRTASFQ